MASSCVAVTGASPSLADAGVATASVAAMTAIPNNEMRFMSFFPGSLDCDI
jgi:hypothetical protein